MRDSNSMLIKDPSALERRMVAKEPDKKQGLVILIGAVMFIFVFTISGLDYRFGWSKMHIGIVIAAVAAMLFGYAMFISVMFQNSYAARVVDTYDNQKVITTGLYAIVRHPMYLATLRVFSDADYSRFVVCCYTDAYISRYPCFLHKNEEAFLIEQLEGYRAYVKKVKYRILPLIW